MSARSQDAPIGGVLAEAQEIINGPRRDAYGDARESFRAIAVGWSEIIGAEVTGTQVALCMDWLKTCRFLTARDRDSLVDKGGYTALAARLEGIDPCRPPFLCERGYPRCPDDCPYGDAQCGWDDEGETDG